MNSSFPPLKFLQSGFLIGSACLFALWNTSAAKGSTLSEIIVSRQGLRGIPNAHLGSFGAPTINDTGAIAVYATLYGKGVDSTTNSAIALINRSGTGRVIVQNGDNINADGSSFWNFLRLGTSPVINKTRHIAWTGEYVVYTPSPVDVFTIGLGTPSGGRTEFASRNAFVTGFPVLSLNKRNACSLMASLFDDVNQQNEDAVFRITASSALALAEASQTPIGMPLGSTYSSFGNPTIDDRNYLYYNASVTGSVSTFDGIWFGKNGDPVPLVLKGQAAPGTASNFSDFLDSPSPSPDGTKCAFTGSAGGSNNGVWIADTKSKVVTNVATTSTRVSGTTDTLNSFQAPGINNTGETAFLATSSSTGKLGIYGSNGSGLTKLIAVGDLVTIDGKDKHIIDIQFNPVRALNSHGTVVFTASFDDRTSGVFTTTL
jgi:hypothetical protein